MPALRELRSLFFQSGERRGPVALPSYPVPEKVCCDEVCFVMPKRCCILEQ